MGICFHWYVVDLPSFERMLDLDLKTLLARYTEDVRGPDRSLSFFDSENEGVDYCAREGKVYRREVLKPDSVEVPRAGLEGHPFLATPLGEYIRFGSDSGVLRVLSAFRHSSQTPFITLLEAGESGRWWVGSFINGAERSVSMEDFAVLVRGFKKLLRRLDCGRELPGDEWGLEDFCFPFMPSQDSQYNMAVWSAQEIQQLTPIIGALRSNGEIRYEPPLDWLRKGDTNWTPWVHRELDLLLRIESLGYSEPTLISFAH